MPDGVRWGHVAGVSVLGGVGFTMAIFVTNLAFADPVTIAMAKAAILAASLVAGVAGFLVLRKVTAEGERQPGRGGKCIGMRQGRTVSAGVCTAFGMYPRCVWMSPDAAASCAATLCEYGRWPLAARRR